jgi:internalin A
MSSKVEKLIWRAYRDSAEELDLGDFDDEELPSSLGDLLHLKVLHVTGCRNLREIPDSIGNLRHLTRLSIRNSALIGLPESIGELQHLSSISVTNSQLLEIPAAIGALFRLERIQLTDGSLLSIPASILNLRSLRDLVLRGNRLASLPEEVTGLRSLLRLNVASNLLRALPDALGRLSQLESLIVSGNTLESLPASIGDLQQLEILRIGGNRLSTLPTSIRQLKRIREFTVRGNDLGLPAEIETAGFSAACDFLFRSSERRKLGEAKILLVGQGGVGKTSLVNRLLDGTFNPSELKTDGIRVRDWSVGEAEKTRLNVWDFGGQEIMHATHQFFLTKRSLYILVLDARAGEREGNLHYWLEMIRVYGANSPVLVVLNKAEEHHDKIDENRLRLDYAGLVSLVGFHSVSCKTGDGLTELRSAIETAVRGLPHVSDYLPADYFAVKEYMEERAIHADFITEEEYLGVCRRLGVRNPDDQDRLLRFLHDLGCVLHYDDPDQKYHVHDTRVLNPAWVTGGVYRVLNDPELLRGGNGVVHRGDFRRLLDRRRYPSDRYPFLIDIMRKYELCIEFPDDKGRLLVPELLSKNEPDVAWAKPGTRDVLAFQYHYTVLPRGLIPRFIVRAQHLLTERPTVWRAGVVLEVESCRVLIRGDLRTARVFVEVHGSRDRRRALAVVRDALSAVHASYGELKAEAKIPLPRDPSAPPVDYQHLVRLERQGVREHLFEKAAAAYDVRELLDGVDERRFDAFMSHNSRDKPLVRELAKLLQAQGVRVWLDEQQLTPGEMWQGELARGIRECHSILILVGMDGLGAWAEQELSVSLDHAAKAKKRLIPVFLPGLGARPPLPPQFEFLASRTWIEFAEDFSEGVVSRLVRAIKES